MSGSGEVTEIDSAGPKEFRAREVHKAITNMAVDFSRPDHIVHDVNTAHLDVFSPDLATQMREPAAEIVKDIVGLPWRFNGNSDAIFGPTLEATKDGKVYRAKQGSPGTVTVYYPHEDHEPGMAVSYIPPRAVGESGDLAPAELSIFSVNSTQVGEVRHIAIRTK